MKFVVLGAGRVGFGVARALSFAENDVSVIDISRDNIKLIGEKLDVKPILGHAADIGVLKDAGIENADYLIAVTSSDEVNLIACEIANLMFQTPFKISRISGRSYYDNKDIFYRDKFSLDLAIFPDIEIAETIKKSILIPEALNVVSCFNDTFKIVGVICRKNSPLAGAQLRQIRDIVKDLEIAIICICRGVDLIIPTKSDFINGEDSVYFLASHENISKALKLFGVNESGIGDVIIIGGGNICKEVVLSISNSNLDMRIKIIEPDKKQAEILSENFNKINVLYGNPLEKDIIDISDMKNAELVISITNDDKINILSCLIAKKSGAKRVSAILNDSVSSDVLYSLGVNVILDSKQAIISKILRFIRKGRMETLLGFEDGSEIISIDVVDNSHIIGSLTDDICSNGEILIIAIYRNNEAHILPKRMLISSGDKVIFISKKTVIDRILNLFHEKPKYLATR
ncbi:MAG: Trk system potassium transporter TrkA [Holosporales bacterium]|jgi:trk system potassium uptake protein TrkA|nr:Trk system potassium transporter TrkA [Holosporales bacterium]